MMDLQQRRASYELLQAGLSHQGYLKVATIMSLESVLRELRKIALAITTVEIRRSTGSRFLVLLQKLSHGAGVWKASRLD